MIRLDTLVKKIRDGFSGNRDQYIKEVRAA
jgi:hypothetical protein